MSYDHSQENWLLCCFHMIGDVVNNPDVCIIHRSLCRFMLFCFGCLPRVETGLYDTIVLDILRHHWIVNLMYFFTLQTIIVKHVPIIFGVLVYPEHRRLIDGNTPNDEIYCSLTAGSLEGWAGWHLSVSFSLMYPSFKTLPGTESLMNKYSLNDWWSPLPSSYWIFCALILWV